MSNETRDGSHDIRNFNDPFKDCQTGCKHFTGGEVRHHPDCVWYPESVSKMLDDAQSERDRFMAMLGEADVISFPELPTLIKLLNNEWGIRLGTSSHQDVKYLGKNVLEAFEALKEEK